MNNPTSFQWSPASTASETYSDNGLNQVTTVGANSAAHDSNGNLTTHPAAVATMPQPALTITSDTANRQIEVTNKATYEYDGESRRVKKTCTAGCTTIEYLYAGTILIAEYDGSGNLKRRYVPGPAGEPVVWYEYNAGALTFKRWFYADRLGSIVTEADDTGNVITADLYTYGPYGEVHSGGGLPTGGSTFRYTGQIWDSESGLLYLRARMYSASLGRFNSTDPIGFDGGMNLYAYVGNDPANNIDPGGLTSMAEYAARGIRIINATITGSHPITGIPFKNGFPDFSSVAIQTVDLAKVTGNRGTDAIAANAAAGLKSTPDGYVWHHAENGLEGAPSTTMQLVPADIHTATGHTGTAAYAKAIGGLFSDILTDPTTYLSAGIGTFLSVMTPTPANAGEDERLQAWLAANPIPIATTIAPSSGWLTQPMSPIASKPK